MTADAVSVDLADHVATVEIHRPPHNWFDIAVMTELADAVLGLDDEPECRALVLCSEGKNFCAGADLKGSDLLDVTTTLYEQAARLFSNRKPIVAAVQGAAVGGGLGLVARGRLPRRVARDPLQLQLRQARVPPGLRHLGDAARGRRPAARARAHVHRGRRTRRGGAAHRPRRPPGRRRRAARRGARVRVGDRGVGTARAALDPRDHARRPRRPGARPRPRGEHQEQQRLRQTDDFHEGVTAIAERRPPNFTGR